MNEQEQQSAAPSEGGEDQGAGKKRRRRRRRSRRPGEDGPQGSEPRAEGETADDQGDDDDSEDEGESPRSDGNGQAATGDDVRKKKRRKKKKRPEDQPTTADGSPQPDQAQRAPREEQPREPREPRQPREQQPREPREPRQPREQREQQPREPREQREPRQPRDQQRRPEGNRPQQGAKPDGDKPARAPRGSVLARRAQRLDMGVHNEEVEEQVVPSAPAINTSSVDSYVNSHRGWQREVLMKLRDMIRSCAQDSTENISWSQPVFDLNGPMCYLKAFTDHVNFGFWRGTELDDPEGLLVGDLTKMRHVKISSVNDVNRERFESFIRQAAKLNREKGDPTV